MDTVGAAYRSIALTLIVTFFLSLGYLHRKHKAPHVPAPLPATIETPRTVSPQPLVQSSGYRDRQAAAP